MSDEKNEQDRASAFKKEFKNLLDSGINVSRKGLKRAGKTLSEIGDVSVIKIEIAKCKLKLEKKYIELGKLCSSLFLEKEVPFIDRSAEGMDGILCEIERLKEKIGEEELKLKQKGEGKELGEGENSQG